MSRAVILSAILADDRLQDLGFDASTVLTNYDADQRPQMTSTHLMFMVIRWGVQDTLWPSNESPSGPRHFDIWIHMPSESSTDYTHIDDVIEILDDIFGGIIQSAGGDGRTVSIIEREGRSGDFKDDVYQTICRSASYKLLTRVTV